MITRAELYAGRRALEQPIETLLSQMLEVELSSAMAAGRVLMTRNLRHFERIGGLEIAEE